MTIPTSNLDITVDTFGTLINRTNQLAHALTNFTVTVDSTTSGNNTTGNGAIIGRFGANTLFAGDSLRGGNVAVSNTLYITSNVNISNAVTLTSNTVANTLNVTGLANLAGGINTTTANVTLMNSGANVNINTTAFFVGNSTVNTVITATSINTDGTLVVQNTASFANTVEVTGLANLVSGVNTPTVNTSSINIGANVNVNTSTLFTGNSTVNTVITSTGITTSNTINVGGLANLAGGINTATVNATSINVGANVAVTTSNITVSNSISGCTAAISANAIQIGNTVSNATHIRADNGLISGNLTVSGTFTTASAINAAGSIIPSVSNSFSLGNTSSKFSNVNSFEVVTDITTVSTRVNVGSNVTINTTAINVGNSTVNATINSTAFDGTSNNTNNLNGQPASFYTNATNITTGTIDTARLPATANIATSVNVGSNVNLTTVSVRVGNTTANVLISNNQINVNGGTINSTSFTGNANTANTLSTSRNFSITGSEITASNVSFNGSGDVALSASLSTTGVGAGQYTKVTVDTKGRVTSGNYISNSDVTNALGNTAVANATNLNGQPASYYLPSGGDGEIQYNKSGRLSSSQTQLFWDTFNDRLGIGTNTPSGKLSIQTAAGVAATQTIYTGNSSAAATVSFGQIGAVQWDTGITAVNGNYRVAVNGGQTAYEISRAGTSINYHAFLTSGTERVRIASDGNVGIGTTSPASRLAVNGQISSTISSSGILQTSIDTASSINWQVGSDGTAIYAGTQTNHPLRITTNNAERMRIDASGNVGIGTNSPSSFGRLAVSTPTQGFGLFSITNSAGGGGGVQLASYYSSAKISYIDTTVTNGTPGSETAFMGFATANNGSLAERMRIDASGNVGIGTNSPGARLEVAGAGMFRTGTDDFVHIAADGGAIELCRSAGGAYIDFKNSGSEDNDIRFQSVGNNGTLSISSSGIERMSIAANGNVGIGASSPAAKLHVVGATNLTALYVNGFGGSLYVDYNGLSQNYYDANTHIFRDSSYNTRLQFASLGQIGIGGANYGTAGQVLTSGGSGAAPSWTTVALSGRLLNVQTFTSSGTYTRTAGAVGAVVIAVGGGGGGKGVNNGNAGGNGGNGGTTSFGSHVSAAGGSGATDQNGGAGGTGGTGSSISIPGQGGGAGFVQAPGSRFMGGIGGGQGGGRSLYNNNSVANGVNGGRGGGGSGGSGGANCVDGYSGGGGGQGETSIKYITSVGATETVTIGAGGAGGTGAPGNTGNGGDGGAGYIIVYEYS